MYYEVTDCIDKPRITKATTMSEAKATAERLFAGSENIHFEQVNKIAIGIYNDQRIHLGNIWKMKGHITE